MDEAQPFFSVVIAGYNAEKFVAETMESVQNQTNKEWELIFVDDGSTDSTVQIVSRYPCKIIELKKNIGQPAARNVGIKKALGKYIAVLDADDLWTNDKLAMCKQYFIEYPECSWIYSDAAVFTGTSKNIQYVYSTRRKHFNGNIYKKLFLGNFIPSPTPVIKKSVFEKVGYFEEMINSAAEDWAMWLKISSQFSVGYISKVLALYRKHPNSQVRNTSIDIWVNNYMTIIENNIKKNYLELEPLRKKAQANAYKNVAKICFNRKDPKNARKLFWRSFTLNPNPVILLWYSICWVPLGILRIVKEQIIKARIKAVPKNL
jgi:glycosyltransferase involved in cell wall biosynthesis